MFFVCLEFKCILAVFISDCDMRLYDAILEL
jgi:hypothetical protein